MHVFNAKCLPLSGYGMTELTLAVLLNIPGRPLKKGSTGQVLPNCEVIVSATN